MSSLETGKVDLQHPTEDRYAAAIGMKVERHLVQSRMHACPNKLLTRGARLPIVPLVTTTDSDTHDETYDWRRKGPCRHISAAKRRAIRKALAEIAGGTTDTYTPEQRTPTEPSHG